MTAAILVWAHPLADSQKPAADSCYPDLDMRWRGRRRSRNVEDRRGRRVAGAGLGLGLGGLLVVVVLALVTGVDPTQLIQSAEVASPGPVGAPPGAVDDETTAFVKTVLADTEDTWKRLFEQVQRRYREPMMVLFSGQVQSACGFNSAAVGPFYCPADEKIYLDLSFFRVLAQRFGAPGDFAQAYVIAHEVGHHVQNQLGISAEARRSQVATPSRANYLSVQLELQADCFAGVWGHHARGMLEPGDIEEGLRAAAAIGDDTLQNRSRGYTVPESWTHGSAEMRVRWLRKGLESGDPNICNTFQ